jgi:hypothetical protein
MKRVLLFFGCIPLVIDGCSSLEPVTSVPEDQLGSKKQMWVDYDSHIQYMVSNNANNLHLKLITTDRETVGKILRNGLYVYFDLMGKKKKDIFLQYPLENSMGPGAGPMQNQGQNQG